MRDSVKGPQENPKRERGGGEGLQESQQMVS